MVPIFTLIFLKQKILQYLCPTVAVFIPTLNIILHRRKHWYFRQIPLKWRWNNKEPDWLAYYRTTHALKNKFLHKECLLQLHFFFFSRIYCATTWKSMPIWTKTLISMPLPGFIKGNTLYSLLFCLFFMLFLWFISL